MRVIEAPELPDNYKFVVTLGPETGDVVLRLKRKTWLGMWKTVGWDYFDPKHYSATGELEIKVEDAMRRLAANSLLLKEVRNKVEQVLGEYPPRKIIGEVDEL